MFLFSFFLTTFKLTSLLEEDLSRTSRDFCSSKDLLPNQTFGGQVKHEKNPRLITYSVFLEAYWPHFSQKLTKGLGMYSLSRIFLSYSPYLYVQIPHLSLAN